MLVDSSCTMKVVLDLITVAEVGLEIKTNRDSLFNLGVQRPSIDGEHIEKVII